MTKATHSADKAQSTTAKQVQVIARYEIKRDRSHRSLVGHVAYLVRSSDGKSEYCTTLVQGKATGWCTCPSKKPCYHMQDLEKIEAARGTKTIVSSLSSECGASNGDTPLQCPPIAGFTFDVVGQEEVAVPLSREAYVSLFDPCYIG